MLYWLGVYLLVVIGVAAPLLLLYLLGVVLWLILREIGSVARSLIDAWACQADVSRAPWSAIRRKAA